MGNAWITPSISHSTGKCGKILCLGWNWEIGTHIFHIVWVILPHVFPIVQKNATKLILWGAPGKLVLILSPYYGLFFLIRFPFYGILHHMGNACIFLLISRNIGKDIEWGSLGNWFPKISFKTHCMWRTWEIGTHTFPIVWVLFSSRFTFYGIIYNMWNTWVFPSVSHSMGKCNEIHRCGRA